MDLRGPLLDGKSRGARSQLWVKDAVEKELKR